MKIASQNALADSSLITLHDQVWLDRQRMAGKAAAGALVLLEQLVKDRTTKSLLELDRIAEEYILEHSCAPTFKGYRGFPNCCCISVNQQLVHGIPTDYHLQDGDLISFDLGATFEGAIADTALTCIWGEPKEEAHVKLVQATKDALTKAIETVAVGKRLGVIGNAIYKHGKDNGFSVVENYGGHGISMTASGIGIPHAPPFVANRSNPNEGVIIQVGMVLAIEPLFVLGSSTKTRTLGDGWTVACENMCSHHEHSVYIHENRVEIITERHVS